jgi:hypothetical protein
MLQCTEDILQQRTLHQGFDSGGEEQGGALGDVGGGLRGGWSRWGFGAMAKFVMLVEERREKREVDGNLEADGWACWLVSNVEFCCMCRRRAR